MTTGIRSGSGLCRRTAALLIASALVGVLASAPAFAQGQQVERRWELDETPYDQQNFFRKVGSNLRDGTVGLIDSIAQGVLSVVGLINPRSGGVALQKVATFGGDIVGLIDNNPGTQYVFKGIISRQLLRFGAGAKGASQGIAFIHDTEFEDVPGLELEDYVGDSAFHPRAYGRPSIVVGALGIVAGDFVVRPIGNILMIFGLRGTAETMDEWGKDVIEASLRVPFL